MATKSDELILLSDSGTVKWIKGEIIDNGSNIKSEWKKRVKWQSEMDEKEAMSLLKGLESKMDNQEQRSQLLDALCNENEPNCYKSVMKAYTLNKLDELDKLNKKGSKREFIRKWSNYPETIGRSGKNPYSIFEGFIEALIQNLPFPSPIPFNELMFIFKKLTNTKEKEKHFNSCISENSKNFPFALYMLEAFNHSKNGIKNEQLSQLINKPKDWQKNIFIQVTLNKYCKEGGKCQPFYGFLDEKSRMILNSEKSNENKIKLESIESYLSLMDAELFAMDKIIKDLIQNISEKDLNSSISILVGMKALNDHVAHGNNLTGLIKTFDNFYIQTLSLVLEKKIPNFNSLTNFTLNEILKAKLISKSFSLDIIHEMFKIERERKIAFKTESTDSIDLGIVEEFKDKMSFPNKMKFKKHDSWIFRDYEIKNYDNDSFRNGMKMALESNQENVVEFCNEIKGKFMEYKKKLDSNIDSISTLRTSSNMNLKRKYKVCLDIIGNFRKTLRENIQKFLNNPSETIHDSETIQGSTVPKDLESEKVSEKLINASSTLTGPEIGELFVKSAPEPESIESETGESSMKSDQSESTQASIPKASGNPPIHPKEMNLEKFNSETNKLELES